MAVEQTIFLVYRRGPCHHVVMIFADREVADTFVANDTEMYVVPWDMVL